MPIRDDWYRGKYPPTLVEAAITHSLLANLGYSLATEIFLQITPKDVFVVLKAEGMEAGVRVGPPELSPEEMTERWRSLIGDWNKGGSIPDEEKDCLWEASATRQHLVEIVFGLVSQGLKVAAQNAERVKAMRSLH